MSDPNTHRGAMTVSDCESDPGTCENTMVVLTAMALLNMAAQCMERDARKGAHAALRCITDGMYEYCRLMMEEDIQGQVVSRVNRIRSMGGFLYRVSEGGPKI